MAEIAVESDEEGIEAEEEESPIVESPSRSVEFRQQGKIFVGNLPSWIKKSDVAEFFRQFVEVKSEILIRAHETAERNAGFGFEIFAGDRAERAVMKVVEFDGMEFHGRVLTMKLDDGRRLKERTEERARWARGDEGGGREHLSRWHEEREGARGEFRRVVETEPENWQAVVQAFQRINKAAKAKPAEAKPKPAKAKATEAKPKQKAKAKVVEAKLKAKAKAAEEKPKGKAKTAEEKKAMPAKKTKKMKAPAPVKKAEKKAPVKKKAKKRSA